MSILNVENLTYGFGDKTLFNKISFRMLRGEHIGLLGDNGVGKTTFLNLLSGALLPDDGKIEWASSVSVGYLDQHSKLQKGVTIRETLKTAFKSLYDIETKIIAIGDSLMEMSEDEMEKALNKMGRLQDTLDNSVFYRIDSYIDNVASGLGLLSVGMDSPVDKLSGGQRTKVLLAKLLLSKPDILLLDEPTNYLDKEHIEWLRGYLENYENSFILISHDTSFLNKVVNVIYHIEFCDMKRYPGNYEKYIQLSTQERKEYFEAYERQQQQIKKMEQFIKSNIALATTSTRAKSRRKQLEKIERLEKPKTLGKPSYRFTNTRASGKTVMESKNLSIGYTYPLLNGLNMRIERGQKIAITGCNGIGKSTLLKTIMGQLPSLDGNIKFGDYLYPLYFEQESGKTDYTPLDYIWDAFPSMKEAEIRSALARCGLKSEHILRPMSSLSGGEQSKTRLCKLMLTPGNWLLLDEPTNHLDVNSKEALKKSLISYDGTIILVCHEHDFYKDWVSDVWNMESYIIQQA